MRKFQLTDFMKSAAAFGVVSASGVDAWLYAFDRLGWLKTSPDWFLVGPAMAWGVLAIRLSFSLGERLDLAALKRPDRITPLVTDGAGGAARAIPWHKPSGSTTLLAHTVQSIFGSQEPVPPRRVIGWNVNDITVGVNELQRFLELCDRRPKYKFSMRYWCERRRPPMPRKRYDATMELLTRAGLIEARQSGASGWLRGGLKPRHAIEYLTDPKCKTANLAVFSV